MNDGLSDDIKKFMLPLTIELQDHHKEKVYQVYDYRQHNCLVLKITITIIQE